MAAGKHGGYRNNEFKDRESVVGFRSNDYYYSKEEYHGYRSGDREIEWRKERSGSEMGKRDSYKRREEREDDYHGKSGVLCERTDRESGELSSGSESDGSVANGSRFYEEVLKVELPPSKKQKLSPEVSNKEEVSSAVCGSPVKLARSGSRSGSSTLSYQDQEMVQVQEEDFVPSWNISASRWADEEGEVAIEEEIPMKKKKVSALGLSRAEVSSPELGEMRRIASDRVHAKSSESDRSMEDSEKNDDMELDEENQNRSSSTYYSDDSEEDNYSCGSPEQVGPPRRSVNMLQGCGSLYDFERLNKINEGTYGVVFRAKDKRSGEIVALKKVKMEKEREGFPLTALREINILLSSYHPSIVDVKEVVMGKSLDEIYMVMEYMEHDLKGLMEKMKHPFSTSEVKCLMLQLLEGVKYLHDNWVLHRDLKTSNILFNNQGELKICDFGLSRQYGSPLKPYTALVVTLWYRAPELLLGEKQYSTAIDMWSLGCIMAELISKQPLFSGKTEVDQLDKIFRILGTPSERIWPGFSNLPGAKVNFRQRHNILRSKFSPTSFTGAPILSDAGFDLLSKLLAYDPEKRITAEEAVNHPWFHEVPLPKSKDFMPTFPPQNARDRQLHRIIGIQIHWKINILGFAAKGVREWCCIWLMN